ncbi:MAG TPA: hypothetical protein VIF84_04215 [Candidatus Limnocylindrales bacterium]|jgi:hypothetical protein
MTRDDQRPPDPAGEPPTSTDPDRIDAADVVSGPIGWAKLRDPATVGNDGDEAELPSIDVPPEPVDEPPPL